MTNEKIKGRKIEPEINTQEDLEKKVSLNEGISVAGMFLTLRSPYTMR